MNFEKKNLIFPFFWICNRECVSTGAAGARTLRSLGHNLLHPLILRPRALFYRTNSTCRSKSLTHPLSAAFVTESLLSLVIVLSSCDLLPMEESCQHPSSGVINYNFKEGISFSHDEKKQQQQPVWFGIFTTMPL